MRHIILYGKFPTRECQSKTIMSGRGEPEVTNNKKGQEYDKAIFTAEFPKLKVDYINSNRFWRSSAN